jgi:hypothetical protein
MSERLRNANEQVMGVQGTLDEKLKIFNLKLDTEQRLLDVTLKAAQTMFDQTKLRADEVISSAERSRGRLQWAATVIGGFVTVVVGVLGFVGAKQIYDINQVKTETAISAMAQRTRAARWRSSSSRYRIPSSRSRRARTRSGRRSRPAGRQRGSSTP